jgi:hypothetical protein
MFRSRGARRFIFKLKIPFWVNFEGLWNRKCWCVFGHLENFNSHLVILVVIWYIFPGFGILCQYKSGNPVQIVKSLLNFDGLFALVLFFIKYDHRILKLCKGKRVDDCLRPCWRTSLSFSFRTMLSKKSYQSRIANFLSPPYQTAG